ncbi:hypothetical protein G7077_05080 [Sphingomonas piscis]|uniref:Uncharacterized protein n=1 Tax=Sphingomonas piscis TaxID=2714943 RepID=A0A6G7YNQ7_9SPHN|nr:hypothetical protein [Sphingomonas piscis]QIK78371.1 hypothetical protein G7077_05080 [Sphingomonas piscis]
MTDYEFPLGRSQMAAGKLHALLKDVAPAAMPIGWYHRSPSRQKDGKFFMTIYTDHPNNLMRAKLAWSEPEVGE